MTRFLALSAAAFAGFLLFVAGFNLWVDPYRTWHLNGGYSEANPRPRAIQHVALFKQRAVAMLHPVTLVLGNSRAEIGFDPDSAYWPQRVRPVFNAAIPGSGIETALHAFARATETGQVRQLVVGLEFLDFLVDPSATMQVVPQTLPSVESDTGRLITDTSILLSLDTLFDSVITVLARHDRYSADITSYGFNPLREYEFSAMHEGYGKLFLQRDTENARAYAKLPKAILVERSGTSKEWQILDQLLAIARRNDTDIKFVIYPYHAHILQLLKNAHLVPAFEAWKRRLVEVIQSGRAPSTPQCSLWDFSGYHMFAREPVPALGDTKSVVESYWEAGHFKRQLGDRMLARMFGIDTNASGFGTCLTAANVDDTNAKLERDQDRYAVENPELSAELARLALVRTIRSERK